MAETEIRAMSARFTEALAGAANLHAAQGRKGTDTPYIAHLLGVASIALEYGGDEDVAIAALLHDAIEDAPDALGPGWVRRWMAFRFGPRVLEIVEGCTDTDKDPKPEWVERTGMGGEKTSLHRPDRVGRRCEGECDRMGPPRFRRSWPDFVFAFPDIEEVGRPTLARPISTSSGNAWVRSTCFVGSHVWARSPAGDRYPPV